MTAADLVELCARFREPGVTKTLRCVRIGPPTDCGGKLPDDLVRDGLVQLLRGPRRLEVRAHVHEDTFALWRLQGHTQLCRLQKLTAAALAQLQACCRRLWARSSHSLALNLHRTSQSFVLRP